MRFNWDSEKAHNIALPIDFLQLLDDFLRPIWAVVIYDDDFEINFAAQADMFVFL